MDKLARWILKLVGTLLALAAVVCVVVGFWDDIEAFGRRMMMRLRKKCCPEYDYYDEDDEEQSYFAE